MRALLVGIPLLSGYSLFSFLLCFLSTTRRPRLVSSLSCCFCPDSAPARRLVSNVVSAQLVLSSCSQLVSLCFQLVSSSLRTRCPVHIPLAFLSTLLASIPVFLASVGHREGIFPFDLAHHSRLSPNQRPQRVSSLV
ncbi:hypothetical protein C8R45DRAFT_300684 [Mycena sanguinolenta]|nr:hypothetical protein C8R45DRAFT_300684 [Mycena sanguinolenta]